MRERSVYREIRQIVAVLEWCLHDVDLEEKRAHATSVPTVFVDELAKANLASNSGRILHHYGDFWVKALGSNLLGMHLDFQKESVDSIKLLASDTDRPFVILNAAVAKTQILEPILDNSFINTDVYEKWIKLEEPEIKPKPRNDGPSFGM